MFRLGASGYDWRATYGEPGTRAASASALAPAEAERTTRVIGTVGGLLADLGSQVFAARAMTGRDLRPSLLIWVGGTSTSNAEREELRTIGVPGISVALNPVSMDRWRHIDSGEVDDWRRLARRFVAEVGGLVELPHDPKASGSTAGSATDDGRRDGRSSLLPVGDRRRSPDQRITAQAVSARTQSVP